jgi:3-isopropylmalate dehydrogenase
LRLRKALDLYANIRPANFASEALLQYSPLKPEIAKGTDIIVLRELVGGLCMFPSHMKVVADDRLWKEAGTE